jgi:Protein of unknown function (DUF1566)
MKKDKLLLFAFLLIATISVQAQITAVPVAGVQKSTTHYIGESYGGGIVFYITPDALHGLVVETKDLNFVSWYNAQDVISTVENHSTAGKNFTDWRLPTKYELNLLFGQRIVVGGFNAGGPWWSSTEVDGGNAWVQTFPQGTVYSYGKGTAIGVRAVRAF